MPGYTITTWSSQGGRRSRVISASLHGAMRETTAVAKLFGQATLKRGRNTLMICQHVQKVRAGRPRKFMGGFAKCEVTPAGRTALRSSRRRR